MEESVQAKYKKDEPQQIACDGRCNFHMPLRYVDLCWLQTGLCAHFLQRRRQESLRINFSGHQFLGPSGSNEVYIRNAHESKDGTQIRCDAEYENGKKQVPRYARDDTGWPFGAPFALLR